ncbi:MAG TPA: FAD-binding oxidoreductase [Candidatus Saccharimonadales bacterium]|nr:FAD-binding oxidoreductase [Candidatus Saccharimonadales bacterium]
MSKVAHYLQEHLVGEVVTSVDARRYFSTDGSVFSVPPAMIVYPRSENDVRKTMRFAWQLAERGRVVPVTARGAGTDQSGAAIGSGIMLVFPAHMNRIIEFDSKSGVLIVEPGINYGKLQQTLETHSRFLPPFPASFEYSTVGGAIANNASGEKSVKYGATDKYVQSLRVVLANGEVIETRRISKRELSKKLGLATFEGEIYRALDVLIEENQELIERMRLPVTKNVAGYNLLDVKRKDGSFDLTPLLVGAQGTLGIITEATLKTEPYNPETTLLVAHFDDVTAAQNAVQELRNFSEQPSAIEMVDGNLLEAVEAVNPNQLKDVINQPFPAVVLLVEFDTPNDRQQKKYVKRATKVMERYATQHQIEQDPEKQAQLWKIRHASATVISQVQGRAKAVPIIEDGVVPLAQFADYLRGTQEIFKRNGLQLAVWGHAGDANLHLQPYLDLSQVGDRQKAFKVADEYYKLVISLGGSTSGEHNDGRIRAPYLSLLYGNEVYGLLQKVKQIFDPYNSLNPGVKMNVSLEDIRPLMRHEYGLEHLYQHMPRS